MKLINKFILLLCLVCCASCNYLDIVPDEKATEADAFKNPKAALRYLYSCYSYMPISRIPAYNLDMYTGDDVVTPWEQNAFGVFIQGTYTPSNPGINYWHDLYKGIRQCYLLKENIGSVPGMAQEERDLYVAEADFLIAYYHYVLVRTYGPIIMIKELFDINSLGDPNTFLPRTPYDECVSWIAEQFYNLSGRLPAVRTGSEYGRATSTAALALRGRMLLYGASPQFNGGEKFRNIYGNFTNHDGTQLISTSYNVQKWVDAANACKDAIDLANENYSLYYAQEGALSNTPEPTDLIQRSLRFTFMDKDNTPEVIWAFCAKESANASILQNQSVPRWGQYCWGGLAITLKQIERFYTENGLPIDEDPEYDYDNRFSVTTMPEGYINGDPGTETLKMNMNREPRFYAWVAFHNGYFEVLGEDKDPKATNAFATKYLRGENNAKHLVQFTKLSNQGLTSSNTQGTKTGYLNKKGAHPATMVSTANGFQVAQYPWPLIRMAELYLNYAEACVECNRLDDAKIYLNLVRDRAGIPDVEESWKGIATLDQNKLRKIIRQERQIELYLENHNFYDLRRWGEAEILGERPRGLSVEQTDLRLFGQPKEVDVPRRFIPAHYLMPLPISEINKNPNLVQNPGYADAE